MTQSQTPRRLPTRRIDVVAAICVLLAGGVLAAGPALAVSAPRESGLSISDNPQSHGDLLPAGFPVERHGEGGLIPLTSRYLGVIGTDSQYWLVRDKVGNVCVVLDDTAHRITGASCGPASDLENGSLSLAVSQGLTGGYQAFLLGDGVYTDDLPSPWLRAGGNLVAIPLDAVTDQTLVLRDADSGSMELVPFSAG